ncbi:MAG TPA: RnfABCDGE type electron transport complex subunit D [Tepidisphaeraceae bacterium]|jgi:Na+-translocating ferredoxin:NAD+ oxidoreductase RnfD subunit
MSETIISSDLAQPRQMGSAQGSEAADSAPASAPQWLLHSGVNAPRFLAMHAMGALFPVTAGVLIFGWRALGVILFVLAFTAAGVFAWRQVGCRGAQLRYREAMWLGLLLSLMLPAHLLGGADPITKESLLPVLASAGLLLVMSIWLLGGIGAGRVHPVLITYLLLFVCFKDALVPHYALERKRIFYGDLFHSMPDELYASTTQPWINTPDVPQYDSVHTDPAPQKLIAYTRGMESPQREWTSLTALLRDHMPPLEDLVVGGHPAPIGSASAAAVIIGGLFLLYRGVIDFRVPLLIFVAATITMIIAPVPVVITETDTIWRWVALRDHDVGWKLGLTLVNYELMAGPLMFTAFFLATSSAVRPITRRARALYAILIGVLAGVFQIYVSVAIGPYLALLIASLITPGLDKAFVPKTLV